MLVHIIKASDNDYSKERNFNTFQDLIDFMKEVNQALILEEEMIDENYDYCITIYDDYIE